MRENPFPINMTNGCPDCGSRVFIEGPHGGASINIFCIGCTSCFNFVREIGRAQRIPDASDDLRAMYVERKTYFPRRPWL